MNVREVGTLLSVIATFDNRQVDEATLAAWMAVLDGTGVTLPEARDAAVRHFRESTAYLQPAHVIQGVRAARRALEPTRTMSERVVDCADVGREHRRLADGTCMLCEVRITG